MRHTHIPYVYNHGPTLGIISPWRPAACTSRPPRAAGENFAKTTFVLGKICLSTTSFPCSSATHDPSLLLRLYLAESSLMSSWVRLHAYVCACVSSSRVCCVFVLCVLGVCVNCRCVCTRVRECAHGFFGGHRSVGVYARAHVCVHESMHAARVSAVAQT